MLSGIVLEFGW